MPNMTSQAVIQRCNELRTYWSTRNTKMAQWYRLIQMVDELKQTNMESFVGNDPRALYNLALHLLDAHVPHRVVVKDTDDLTMLDSASRAGEFLELAWSKNQQRYRHSGPSQSLSRQIAGTLLATGWYSVFSIVADDGLSCYIEPWSPAQTYPMWYDGQLAEVAHITEISGKEATLLASRNGWKGFKSTASKIEMRDFWIIEQSGKLGVEVWNYVVLGNTLVKGEATRFSKIPIYTAPIGGLPDTGAISGSDSWKEEIGQSVIATNESVYKSWNKWWTFSLQLLRDTAQPRIFERSRSGKSIVKPEDVFKRGAIFRGGPEDSVDFLSTPGMPIELRSTQLDLEAMMQRGGVSWAMYGSVNQQMTAYVMSQIASSANQVIKPFHQAIIDLVSDIDTDWLADIAQRSVQPYEFKLDRKLTSYTCTAEYSIEIPGEIVQKATVGRMLDPDFRLSYSYVLQKLFPDIKDAMREKSRVLADMASLHPTNASISLVRYYRQQAAYLDSLGDPDTAKLYTIAAEAEQARLAGQQQPQPGEPGATPNLNPGNPTSLTTGAGV